MKILTDHYHHFITLPLCKVPGLEVTVVPKIEDVLKQDVSKYDILLCQTHEYYKRVKDLHIKKVFLEHTTPFPMFIDGNKYWASIMADPLVKRIVFLTEDQSMRWQCNITDHVVVPPTIDVDAFPQWIGGDPSVLSVCHDLPERNWVCGADVWQETTRGLQRYLIGKNNQALGSAGEGVIGSLPLEYTLKYYAKCNVFFNHTLHSTLPSTLMEAMAIGIPIVTTASYFSVRCLGRSFGFVSNVLPDLRKAVIERMQNPDFEKQAKINERNRSFLKEHYSFDQFAQNWRGVFEGC